jgi:hypothetical protein
VNLQDEKEGMIKSWLSSKTVWWNGLGIVLAQLLHWVFPKFEQAICNNVELTAMVCLNAFTIFCLIGLALRKATHCRIGGVLLALVVLSGCATVNDKLDQNVFYKRDAGADINGRHYDGVVTVPYAKSYDFVFYPKGSVDVLLIRTCHREYAAEKIDTGWFGKNKFKYTYTPVPGIEDVRVCPLRLDTYESSKEGRHSWLLADFETPLNKLSYTLTCNGTISRVNGVAVCQAKEHTYQRVSFDEPMMIAPVLPETCHKPIQKNENFQVYEIKASLGECLFTFESKDGKIGRLTMIAYDGIAIREPQ